MLPSASISERAVRRARRGRPWIPALAGVLQACALLACAGGGPAPSSGGEDDLEELAPAAGARIAPPPGGDKAQRDRQAVDKLLSGLPEDARDGGELSLPADPALLPAGGKTQEERRREFQARQTDEEIVGGAQGVEDRHARSLGELDLKLGVEPEGDGALAPSYTLGIKRIKALFKARRFEDALLEVNDLQRAYPRAPQLLLMKGTLHQRLGQIDLALAAYGRAFEYEPSKRLKAQIDSLKRRIAEREGLRKPREGIVVPGGVEEAKVLRAPPRPAPVPPAAPTAVPVMAPVVAPGGPAAAPVMAPGGPAPGPIPASGAGATDAHAPAQGGK